MQSTEGPVGGHQIIQQRLTAACVFAALMLGGAGVAYPLAEAAIRLLAVVLLVWIWIGPRRAPWRGPSLGVLAVAGGCALLWLIQLVPLPPVVWQQLPYHEIAARVYEAAHLRLWRPLSLTPDLTGATILTLLPPLAAFIALEEQGRRKIIMLIVLFAIGSASLGLLQAGDGDADLLFPFKTTHRDFGVGMFINRNHQACFLLICMPLVLALAKLKQGNFWRWAGAAGVLLLGLGVVATESRTGLFLLPCIGFAMMFQAGVLQSRAKLGGALLAVAVLAPVLWSSTAVQFTLNRISVAADDNRLNYWGNTMHFLPETLPWGTGSGSFRQIYASVEPLGEVGHLYVAHAHNDYLEWLTETGWPGALLLAGLVVVAGFGYRQTLRLHAANSGRRVLAHAGLIGLLVMMACSVTDYPLRMPALAMMGGVLLALIVPAPAFTMAVCSGKRRVGALAAGLLLAVPVVQIGLGEHSLLSGDSAMAVRMMPWSAPAWSARAARQLADGQSRAAIASARQALRIQPMNPEALSNLALAHGAAGDQAQAGAVLLVGAQLGWRDPVVQAWLADQGVRQGSYDVSARALDALLRLGAPSEQPFRVLRMMAYRAESRPALVEVLATRPPWRQGFLNLLAPDVSEQFSDVAALLTDLARAGARADERETSLMRWAAWDVEHFADVARLWTLAGEKGVMGHPAFDLPPGDLPAQAPPLNWRAPPLPGASVNLTQQSGAALSSGVTINSDGIATGPALTQRMVLLPGAYRATLRMLAHDGEHGVAPGLNLTCRGPGGETLAHPLSLLWHNEADGRAIGQANFVVDGGCPSQDLEFILITSQGLPLSYSVTMLRVDRVGADGATAR